MNSTSHDRVKLNASFTPTMKLGAVVIYVDDVLAVLDFYRRAFGFETRFYDPTLGYGELDTRGAMLAFGSHQVGEFLMPGAYERHPRKRTFDVEVTFGTADVPGDSPGRLPPGQLLLRSLRCCLGMRRRLMCGAWRERSSG